MQNTHKNILLFIFSFICIHNSFSFNNTIDSLESRLNQLTEDTNRVNILNELSRQYLNIDRSISKNYCQQAERLAIKLSYKKGHIKSLLNFGKCYVDEDSTKAKFYFDKALQYAQDLNSQDLICNSYQVLFYFYCNKKNYKLAKQMSSKQLFHAKNNAKLKSDAYFSSGFLYRILNKSSEGLKAYLEGLKLVELTADSLESADFLNNIANIYTDEGFLDDAINNYYRAIHFYKRANNWKEIHAYYNIGNCHLKKKEFTKATDAYNTSLKLAINTKRIKNVADAYMGIASVYNDQNISDSAIISYKKALLYATKSRYEYGIVNSHAQIAEIYSNQNKYNAALEELTKIDAEISPEKDLLYYVDYAKLYSKVYAKLGNCAKSSEYLQLYIQMKDSLVEQNRSTDIINTRAVYDFEEQEKEIELQRIEDEKKKAEINKQKTIRNILLIVVFLIIFIAIFYFRLFRSKNKLSDELTKLNKDLHHINSKLTEKSAIIEKQSDKIIDSITYAKLIQESMLGDSNELKKHLPNSFTLFEPKDIVSGDFYWFSKIENKLIIVVADCTGHGVPGAFMSMIGNTLLNQIINEKKITRPSEILKKLNEGVYELLNRGKTFSKSRDGMDITICCLDLTSYMLEFSGARNYIYLIENNRLESVRGNLFSIGEHSSTFIEKEFANHQIPITKDTCIYMFSDGYSDQFGGKLRKKIGSSNFKELLLSIHKYSFEKQRIELESYLAAWKGLNNQIDDILVVGFRI